MSIFRVSVKKMQLFFVSRIFRNVGLISTLLYSRMKEEKKRKKVGRPRGRGEKENMEIGLSRKKSEANLATDPEKRRLQIMSSLERENRYSGGKKFSNPPNKS